MTGRKKIIIIIIGLVLFVTGFVLIGYNSNYWVSIGIVLMLTSNNVDASIKSDKLKNTVLNTQCKLKEIIEILKHESDKK